MSIAHSSFGPLRLFSSYTISGALALCLAWGLTYLLLPRLWGYLPKDGGRQFAIDADKSIGKPLSAGIIIIAVFTIVVLVVTPFKSKIVMCLPLGIAACIVGFVDDNKRGGMSEWTLGIADLIVALLTAFIISGFEPAQIWFPIYANTFTAPAWIAIPVMTGVIWLAINAMNCTDGVDGLSANLACITLAALAGLLYIVIGNQEVAHYLHVPHNPAAADWAMTAFTMLGCLFGYLWYNAPPSVVLMGDSGSRPIGWLIGTLVVVSGNPTILFVCGLVIILNGATGLAKVLLIRIFDIRILSDIRFPLHDHARKNLGWAGTQVLMRFSLIHLAVTVLLLTFLLKIR